jgi:hypothetical protein
MCLKKYEKPMTPNSAREVSKRAFYGLVKNEMINVVGTKTHGHTRFIGVPQ